MSTAFTFTDKEIKLINTSLSLYRLRLDSLYGYDYINPTFTNLQTKLSGRTVMTKKERIIIDALILTLEDLATCVPPYNTQSVFVVNSLGTHISNGAEEVSLENFDGCFKAITVEIKLLRERIS